MKFVPKEYQTKTIQRGLNQNNVGLFLPMGLGKTVITLTIIEELLLNRLEVDKVLVIAPKNVAWSVWTSEVKKWEHLKHLKISRVLGSAAKRVKALEEPADIHVINRENVVWLVEHFGKNWPFDMVVIDELTSFKNHQSKRWKALRKVRSKINRVIGLTGTPTPNSLLDLWAQVFLLDQGETFGKTFTGYRERYFVPDQRNRHTVFSWRLLTGAEEKIHSAITDLCISLKSEDYIDLPDKIYNNVLVDLGADGRQQYKTMADDRLIALIHSDIEAATAAAVTTKLLQISGGAAYDDRKQVQVLNTKKIDALGELLEELQGEPCLLFYKFRHELDRILAKFPHARHLQNPNDIDDWNARKIPILLAHPQSAGHGLNLQKGGSNIIWYTLTYSLEEYQQANARLHRQGQQKPVVIQHLIAENTLDGVVLDVLNAKDDGQKALLNAIKMLVHGYKKELVA